jgi:hypothetical protein
MILQILVLIQLKPIINNLDKLVINNLSSTHLYYFIKMLVDISSKKKKNLYKLINYFFIAMNQ